MFHWMAHQPMSIAESWSPKGGYISVIQAPLMMHSIAMFLDGNLQRMSFSIVGSFVSLWRKEATIWCSHFTAIIIGGIRLRFTINQDLPIGECTTLARGRPVEYVDQLPPYDEERPHMYYYYKSTSWNYQREYRVLIRSGSYGEYSESELTEIALGLKFDMRHLQKLVEWVQEGRHSNVSFKRAVYCSNLFAFEYKAFLV